jgi:hypothetical protein
VRLGADAGPDQPRPAGLGQAAASPVGVYLGRLAPASRRGQLDALNTIARLLTNGSADSETVNWVSLSYPQTAAVRAALVERYAPNTSKRMLAALRCVLKECWRLGLMTHDEYARAADIAPVRGQLPPRGRALDEAELAALFKKPVLFSNGGCGYAESLPARCFLLLPNQDTSSRNA